MLRQVALRRLRCLDEHVIGICAGFPHPKRQTWGGSDSKRCFFGDFLCTSKESYPLAVGQWKLWLSEAKERTGFPAFAGMTSEEKAALRRQDAEANIRVANGPEGELRMQRVMTSGELPAGRRTVEALAFQEGYELAEGQWKLWLSQAKEGTGFRPSPDCVGRMPKRTFA